MDMVEVAVSDDAALREWWTAFAAGQQAHRGEAPDPYEFVAAIVRHRQRVEPNRLWTLRDGGRPVAAIEARWWTGPDNRHRYDVEIELAPGCEPPLSVLGPVVDAAEELGRSVVGFTVVAGTPAARLAQEAGGVLGLVDLRNVLHTGELDKATLEDWAERTPTGYSLVRWDDHCPDDLLAPYADLVMAMNTAPRGGLDIEDFVVTPERVRDYERVAVARGNRRWVVAARHDATGEFAGFTELLLNRWRPALAEQGDTVVVPAHRGHGIGRWIKAANLARVSAEAPEVEAVETWNAESNTHMLAINFALGSRPAERWEEYDAPLATALAAVRGATA